MTEHLDFDHHSALCNADPVAYYRSFRERCPVGRTAAHGGYVYTTRYADVVRVARDDETFSSSRAANGIDGVLFSGITVEVRLQAGIGEAELHACRAPFYRGRSHDGRTVLVLGAGNLAAIPAMDVISKMFNEGKTCLLKMNPVNAYLGPFLEDAFGEAIGRNYLGIAYGGADEGAYLAQHAGIDEIHLVAMVFIFAIALAGIYSQILFDREQKEAAERNDRRGLWIAAISYVVVNLALIGSAAIRG